VANFGIQMVPFNVVVQKEKLENFLVKGEVYCLISNLDSSYLLAKKSQNICQQETPASSGTCQTSKTSKLG
jgi:hypothetical protein